MNNNEIEMLTRIFAKLPGLGNRSAKRVVLHLIKNKESLMIPLANMIIKTAENIKTCEICGNLDTSSPCAICSSSSRDESSICVVEEVVDLWAFERGNIYNGKYHVLGGTLSAIEGRSAEDLNIERLIARVKNSPVKEIIIATNPTIDGQTTAHYIVERLHDTNTKLTRLAQGMPLGAELDYMDEGTINTALKARREF